MASCIVVSCVGAGGSGGTGGPGGGGGGGGGGAGGPSIGVLKLDGSSASADNATTILPGSAGPGGTGGAFGLAGAPVWPGGACCAQITATNGEPGLVATVYPPPAQ
jgi:hypothetical protein